MNANILIGKIMECGYTARDISNLLGINGDVLTKKLNNLNRLTIGEARLLKYALDLSDSEAITIFFGVCRHENFQV